MSSHPQAPHTRSRIEAGLEAGDAAADLLRRAGCRPTPQRLLVLQALSGGGHVTAEQALAHVRARSPAVNASTVYRTLDALVRAGLARESDLGGPSRCFELAREHRHHHVVCQGCGAVVHLHDEDLAPLAQVLEDATGYRLTPDREIAIPGLCPHCQAQGQRAGP